MSNTNPHAQTPLHRQMTMIAKDSAAAVALPDALFAMAFMGDLSMGQPIDHSVRVAHLAQAMARDMRLSECACMEVAQIALLRWVGCTANAPDVAAAISDDVLGRGAVLALRPHDVHLLVAPEQAAAHTSAISAIHCEVAALIARTMGLGDAVAGALECLFENWDGSGHPRALQGDAVPMSVYLVLLAGDMEIFSREYGTQRATQLLRHRANKVYPAALVDGVACDVARWLALLDGAATRPQVVPTAAMPVLVELSLLADAIDLKLPWLTGYSRQVAGLAHVVAQRLGLPLTMQTSIQRAGLLHGLGRVATPNAVWGRPGPLSHADWERVRLGPYWMARAARHIAPLRDEAEIASYAYERLDGSGYFRGCAIDATVQQYRVLPVVCAWLALQAPRPWRDPMNLDAAKDQLHRAAKSGLFDPRVVEAVVATVDGIGDSPGLIQPAAPNTVGSVLTPREREVLRCISQGHSNKESARVLGISPSTVRAHVESIFRKLGCNSRAAATLKASILGAL